MTSFIAIDTYECNGCGSCVELCPDLFRMNQDKAEVITPLAELTPQLEEAVAYCPAKCITLEPLAK